MAARVPSVSEQEIIQVVRDHEAGTEDARGFSTLDTMVGLVSNSDDQTRSYIAQILMKLVTEYAAENPLTWEAIRLIAQATRSSEGELANIVLHKLDQFDVPTDAKSRYQALLMYCALGGLLTRSRLEKEGAIKSELRPQWVDLVLYVYADAPEAITSFIDDELRSRDGFAWEDLRRRIPRLFKLLGRKFNSAAILWFSAMDATEQRQFAETIKKLFDWDPSKEAGAVQSRPGLLVTHNRPARRRERSKRAFERVFGHVVRPELERISQTKH